jgi:transposase
MHVLSAHSAGLDVHKKTGVAGVLRTAPTGEARTPVCCVATTTRRLLTLAEWLTKHEVTSVAIKSTGIPWRPMLTLVEEACGVALVNAQQRKTEVQDSAWLADVLRHGVLNARIIPPQPIRDLRALERSRDIHRIQKVRETPTLTRSSAVSDVMGASGRSMIQAGIPGEHAPDARADLAQGSWHTRIPQMHEALLGRVDAHQQMVLSHLLARISVVDQTIFLFFFQIQRSLAPSEETTELLVHLPGVAGETAACMLGEIGVDRRGFPGTAHLAAWAGVCSGTCESAGTLLSGQTTTGSTRRNAALAEVVRVVSHRKDTDLSAQFHRLTPQAVTAVSHRLLVMFSHLLQNTQRAFRHERCLIEALGSPVTLQAHEEVNASHSPVLTVDRWFPQHSSRALFVGENMFGGKALSDLEEEYHRSQNE